MIEFDHIAVAGETLAAATAHCEAALGVSLEQGGEHAVFHTHNTLLGMEDRLYLEAISINPAAPKPAQPRWFDMDRFTGGPRLTNWICRCDDLEATLAALPAGFGAPVVLQRGDLRWRMAVPASGVLPFDNCAPALMAWDGDAHPADRLAPSGAQLRKLTVRHPDAMALADLLAPHLSDARVQFVTGPAALEARIDVADSIKTLR